MKSGGAAIEVLLGLLAFLLVILFVLNVAPAFESKLFPVVKDFNVKIYYEKNNDYYFYGSFKKVRNCKIEVCTKAKLLIMRQASRRGKGKQHLTR